MGSQEEPTVGVIKRSQGRRWAVDVKARTVRMQIALLDASKTSRVASAETEVVASSLCARHSWRALLPRAPAHCTSFKRVRDNAAPYFVYISLLIHILISNLFISRLTVLKDSANHPSCLQGETVALANTVAQWEHWQSYSGPSSGVSLEWDSNRSCQ